MAKLRHVHVQVARLELVRGPPDLTQDALVGEQLPLVDREHAEHVELVRRQADLRTGHRHDPFLEVDHERPDLEDRLRLRRRAAEDCT